MAITKTGKIVKRKEGYYVTSEDGKNLGGPYKDINKAKQRLHQVDYFAKQSLAYPVTAPLSEKKKYTRKKKKEEKKAVITKLGNKIIKESRMSPAQQSHIMKNMPKDHYYRTDASGKGKYVYDPAKVRGAASRAQGYNQNLKTQKQKSFKKGLGFGAAGAGLGMGAVMGGRKLLTRGR